MQSDKSKLFHSLFFPVAFVVLLWLIKVSEYVFHFELYTFGVYPRTIKGLIGIFTSPLIHGSFTHLFSNTIPLLLLGSGLFYYYKSLGYSIFIGLFFITGLWVWISARPSYHIGASGVVYGLATFLFVSGVIKKNLQLAAFSMLVVFLYGSLIWGILPINPGISWESHLMGGIAGIVLAFYYRKQGPQETTYEWQKETEDEEDILSENEVPIVPTEPIIRYIYTETSANKTEE